MGKVKRGNKSKSHSHKSISHLHKKYKTKRKTKDHDQIHEDLKKENFKNLLIQPVDYEITGNGQSYCVHCARYFLDDSALKAHFRTKLHKRRIKALQIEPYTQEEANRAGGLGSYIAPKLLLDIKTQPDKSEFLEANMISNDEKVD